MFMLLASALAVSSRSPKLRIALLSARTSEAVSCASQSLSTAEKRSNTISLISRDPRLRSARTAATAAPAMNSALDTGTSTASGQRSRSAWRRAPSSRLCARIPPAPVLPDASTRASKRSCRSRESSVSPFLVAFSCKAANTFAAFCAVSSSSGCCSEPFSSLERDKRGSNAAANIAVRPTPMPASTNLLWQPPTSSSAHIAGAPDNHGRPTLLRPQLEVTPRCLCCNKNWPEPSVIAPAIAKLPLRAREALLAFSLEQLRRTAASHNESSLFCKPGHLHQVRGLAIL
mmetsp:Transcript_21890/g.40253  ORF Transcript_21890/g.40253 Transcript_21890/m.40253 type:complete len:288 (+) Transcript_21890:54-917(+)